MAALHNYVRRELLSRAVWHTRVSDQRYETTCLLRLPAEHNAIMCAHVDDVMVERLARVEDGRSSLSIQHSFCENALSAASCVEEA